MNTASRTAGMIVIGAILFLAIMGGGFKGVAIT